MSEPSEITICFLSSLHAPNDKRVHFKEALSLVDAGYRVVHISPDDGSTEDLGGVELVGYPGRRSLIGRTRQLVRLYRLAKRVNGDVYHCNEVDSWIVGVALKLLRGQKIVFDAHEISSTNLAERYFPALLKPAVVGGMRLLFACMARMTDRIVLAKQSAALDFPKGGRNHVLVRNYVDLSADVARVPSPSTERSPGPDRPFTVVHLGAINRARGWPQLLAAMMLTADKTVRLRVIGKFGDGTESEFLQQVKELGLGDRVSFNGWIPYDRVQAELSQCDVGIIAFQPVHTNFTHALPHKLFDYMLAGLPVIAPGFAVEVAEVVREADCGVLVDSPDSIAFAAAVDRLSESPQLRRRYGANGRQAVQDRFNWAGERERLIDMYRELTE